MAEDDTVIVDLSGRGDPAYFVRMSRWMYEMNLEYGQAVNEFYGRWVRENYPEDPNDE